MWSRQWLKDLTNKYRANIIIDAAQEYIGTADSGQAQAGRAEWAAASEVNVKFFRGQGYTNPLEVMSNFQGRDLYAIVEYGTAIRAVDSVSASGNPQTMFGLAGLLEHHRQLVSDLAGAACWRAAARP